ncbi:LEAF RUST 10 DISEASE-RESISTANCE LOCUS RECEPTOR-LIKE PROTEIN KINASE-like 1.1 [Macadamia integrifolia]|uniref:LEAF RUST 10 DISEASE-RESISTANCE LOCUS RECEPTOR-LIKE PROTEIN KINASE-like 1.1 n=1 Tax=Macadamia integrifolia TaxID=60698 RepID=UPI001C52995C|nr:LEAF RUST 10 DISEASE-RESISTANCE LOCUS RECEPTOR-LIKE PROTEIN KINASE-like 1.1 [Macadamia integrifolia]
MICTLPLLVVAFPFFFLLSAIAGYSHYCPQNQFCGNINISYPFFNDVWGCGIENLHCINGSTLVIPSGNKNDNWTYEVESIDYTKMTVSVHGRRFIGGDDFHGDSDKCNVLFNNSAMTAPVFHHLLSGKVISQNLTLSVCKRHDLQELDNDCIVEAISDEPVAPRPRSHGSSYDCKVVHLPVDGPPATFHGPVDRVSHLVTFGFRLRWILPQQCLKCEKNGTHCGLLIDDQDNDHFICYDHRWNQEKDDAGNMTQKKIIGIGISAGVAGGILLTSLFFFMFYKKRTGHNLSRVRSFSLKTDLKKGSTHFGIPIFSYAELEEATNNFSSVNVLGDGAFGTVYHGNLQDGRIVAIKRLYHNNYKHVMRFMNEIEILTRLRHQYLVTLYGCTSYRSHELLLVYEFIPNGTVADHLHGDRRVDGSLPWSIRMSIAMETASALSYLHTSDIIHRDVKTSNILLDNHFHVKVADFGLCRLFPTGVSHVSTAPQGTPGYVDPEYHRCYQLTDKSDVYSFGVVLIELISSKPAVDITRNRDEINLANMAMKKIQNGALQEFVDPCLGFESDCTIRRIVTLVAELAFRCLQDDKELRPSMDEVLEILTATGVDQEFKVDNVEVIDILASYDVELLKNTPPPPASTDSECTDILSSEPTKTNTSG